MEETYETCGGLEYHGQKVNAVLTHHVVALVVSSGRAGIIANYTMAMRWRASESQEWALDEAGSGLA